MLERAGLYEAQGSRRGRASVVHGRIFRLPALTSVRISQANSRVARGCRRLDPRGSIRPAAAAPTHSFILIHTLAFSKSL
jgi:hypothetical protein